MDTQTILRIAIVCLIFVGIVFAVLKGRAKPLPCPKCKSTHIRIIDRQTDDIHVETISLPGVGAKTHVRSTIKRACQKCGHIWSQQAST